MHFKKQRILIPVSFHNLAFIFLFLTTCCRLKWLPFVLILPHSAVWPVCDYVSNSSVCVGGGHIYHHLSELRAALHLVSPQAPICALNHFNCLSLHPQISLDILHGCGRWSLRYEWMYYGLGGSGSIGFPFSLSRHYVAQAPYPTLPHSPAEVPWASVGQRYGTCWALLAVVVPRPMDFLSCLPSSWRQDSGSRGAGGTCCSRPDPCQEWFSRQWHICFLELDSGRKNRDGHTRSLVEAAQGFWNRTQFHRICTMQTSLTVMVNNIYCATCMWCVPCKVSLHALSCIIYTVIWERFYAGGNGLRAIKQLDQYHITRKWWSQEIPQVYLLSQSVCHIASELNFPCVSYLVTFPFTSVYQCLSCRILSLFLSPPPT